MTQSPETEAGNVANQQLHAAEKKDAVDNKVEAVMSYLWAMSIVMLIFKKGSSFVRFHATIGLLLFALSIAAIALPAYRSILLYLVVFLSLCGMCTAAQGIRKGLAFIGEIRQKKFVAHPFTQKFIDAWHVLMRDGLSAIKNEKKEEDKSWIEILSWKKDEYETATLDDHQKAFEIEAKKREEHHKEVASGEYKAKVNNIDTDPRVRKRSYVEGEDEIFVEHNKKTPWA